MKTIFSVKQLLSLFLLLPFIGFSQSASDTTKVWTKGGTISVNFSQVSLTNWAAGGKSSASGTLLFNVFGNYEKDNLSWENGLDLGYGLLKEESDKAVKTDDKIDLSSKLGLRPSSESKIFYTVLFNFRTQMTDGYKYPDTEKVISSFMAPGYFTLALGADYKPNDKFSLFVSPLTGKMTVVTDEALSEAYGLDPGKKSRSELGAFIKTQFKTTVVKNVSLETKLDLFSNYLDTPQNIDMHWDVFVNMKINDYLSANLITNMIYDDDVNIAIEKDGVVVENGPRVQFKQLFGVGLSLKF
ncbi:DUF3078 domain-containing protein [Sunxiuqinia sp. sy24]|uniref:DUF3078 domain-containing protein n=1 Tax=Sunxiuqinia sp. sy24 TaxID=3461495 RepID=UPI004045C7E9